MYDILVSLFGFFQDCFLRLIPLSLGWRQLKGSGGFSKGPEEVQA